MSASRSIIFMLLFTRLAVAWTSALYPSTWTPPASKNFYADAFVQDWSYAGYHRGETEPPRAGDTRLSGRRIFRVTASPFFADSTGTNDATLAIQKALDSATASGGGVVFLPAGTYKLSSGSSNQALNIHSSNTVLRGEGAGKTFLWNTTTTMNSKSILKTTSGGSWSSIPSSRTLISNDLRNPTTVVPVESTNAFHVGDQVIVRNRITEAWIAEHKESDWAGMASSFTGFVYQRQILSIDAVAKTLTIDAPIRYALLTRDTAMVHAAPSMLEEVGIEYLSIGNSQITATSGWGENDYTTSGNAGYDAHNSYAITFQGVRNGWIRGVHSYQPPGNTSGAQILSNGILVNQSRGVLVDSCDFGHGQYGGGGGNGYMYRISANESMVRDSRSWLSRHGFVLSHMFASGNVFLRDYDKQSGTQTGISDSEATSGSGSDNHMYFSHSNLFDNCTSENSVFLAAYRPYGGSATTPRHDLTAAHTLYWNTQGLGSGAKGIPELIVTQQARYGYVIGTRGTRTSVNRTASNSTSDSILLKTLPLDSVEGAGQGATLSPASIWADQFSKRMTREPSEIRSNAGRIGFVLQATNGGMHLEAPAYPALAVIRDLMGRVERRMVLEGPCDLGAFGPGVHLLDLQGAGFRVRKSVLSRGN